MKSIHEIENRIKYLEKEIKQIEDIVCNGLINPSNGDAFKLVETKEQEISTLRWVLDDFHTIPS